MTDSDESGQTPARKQRISTVERMAARMGGTVSAAPQAEPVSARPPRAPEPPAAGSQGALAQHAAPRPAASPPSPPPFSPPISPKVPNVAEPAPPPTTAAAHGGATVGTGGSPPVNGTKAADAAADAGAARRTSRRVKIDLQRLKAYGMVTSESEHSQVAEEFRFIKRPLLVRAFSRGEDRVENGNLIMVTSAQPGEGKTFCSVSLAMSIALERDVTVLLVDGDVARPSVHTLLGIEPGLGLVDLLSDTSLDIPDVMVRTDLPSLSVIPAGRPHHLSTELMASDRMGKIVADIAKRYPDRIVIFDSPPALASSIPGILSLYVGQAVFVVEADRSNQGTVDSALALLRECPSISLVLNKARTLGGGYGYGAYYGYGSQN